MSTQLLTTLDANGIGKIINLPNGVNPQDPVTMSQLSSAVEGLSWKTNVLSAPPANVNLASPGSTFDTGYTPTLNDRVLLFNQTDLTENGIYIWNGASTPMTRALDANTPNELTQAVVTVAEGANANATFRQTTVAPTIGTSDIVWVSFGTVAPMASTTTPGIIQIATQTEVNTGAVANKVVTPQTLAGYAGLLHKYSTIIGDGTSTSFTITHNLNTQDVVVKVYRNSGSYDEVIVDIANTSANTATVVFGAPPAASGFKVVVIG